MRHGRDDSGNMVLAMLLTVVGSGLSLVLATTVVAQVKTAGRVNSRQVAVSGAQAGLDRALAAMRYAVRTSGGSVVLDQQNRAVGDLTKLPCQQPGSKLAAQYGADDHNATLTGVLDQVMPTVSYRVTIDYYTVDPTGYQDDPAAINAKRVICLGAGLGPADVPGWALLRATGSLNGAGRELYATYTLATTSDNIPGGRIQVRGQGDLCLGSPVDPPVPGTYATLIACTSPTARRTFTYPKNLNLRIQPAGLCLGANPSAGTFVRFQTCVSPTGLRQQWAFQADRFVFMGTSNGTGDNGLCFTVDGAVAAGSRVRLGSTCGTVTSQYSYTLDGSVGAGAAGPASRQLVNRGNHGYCLDVPRDDVTGQDPYGSGTPALIQYPCKQSFDSTPHWNHVWGLEALAAGQQVAGALYYRARITSTPNDEPTNDDNDPMEDVKHCLAMTAASNRYPWLTRCDAGQVTAANTWRVYRAHPDAALAYRIQDNSGTYCLEGLDTSVPNAEKIDNAWPKVIVAVCGSSPYQKWNVPASATISAFKGLGED